MAETAELRDRRRERWAVIREIQGLRHALGAVRVQRERAARSADAGRVAVLEREIEALRERERSLADDLARHDAVIERLRDAVLADPRPVIEPLDGALPIALLPVRVETHFVRAGVFYETSCGFYIGPTFELASSWNVDFANSLRAGSYAVYGLMAGYDSGEGWRLFAEARNLGDRAYASNTGITANAGGMDAPLFNPGQPFSLVGGGGRRWSFPATNRHHRVRQRPDQLERRDPISRG